MNDVPSNDAEPADAPAELLGYAATVNLMGMPVRWMTLQELRDELDRTRPAWDATDLDDAVAEGELPVLSKDAQRHQMVVNELLRRPSDG
jgi:hypothetical protein